MQTDFSSASDYKIKTPYFEGPFGLLLNLVEKRKLFINDISLAEVTDDYLNFVSQISNTSSREISSFIMVAATLILIKSKSLLPTLDLSKEEEGDIVSLENRLKLYELFNRLSMHVKNSFGKKIIFAPEERKKDILIFLPDERITKDSMMTFAKEVLGKIPQKTFLPEVEIKKVVSIEEMIGRLTSRIEESLKFNFKEFAGKAKTKEEKVEIIVSFLAMLELVRNGILQAFQEEGGEDIIIEKIS